MKAARRGVLPLLLVILSAQASKITDETVARTWLDEYNVRSQVVIYESAEAAWNYNTNLTDYNQNAQVSVPNLVDFIQKQSDMQNSL